jgi:hypothetical protein
MIFTITAVGILAATITAGAAITGRFMSIMMSLPRITAGASQLAAGTLMRLPQRLLMAVKDKVVQALKTALRRLFNWVQQRNQMPQPLERLIRWQALCRLIPMRRAQPQRVPLLMPEMPKQQE